MIIPVVGGSYLEGRRLRRRSIGIESEIVPYPSGITAAAARVFRKENSGRFLRAGAWRQDARNAQNACCGEREKVLHGRAAPDTESVRRRGTGSADRER